MTSKPKRLLLSLVVLAFALLAALYVATVRYGIGADEPHNALTYWLLETVRERSLAHAYQNLHVPDDLNTPQRLLAGGADYQDMCAMCHLRPGVERTDFTLGLYPQPPDLTQAAPADISQKDLARRRFWVIKHGIKASGMASWKYGHDDQRIWNMVAFLNRLPELDASQYRILTGK